RTIPARAGTIDDSADRASSGSEVFQRRQLRSQRISLAASPWRARNSAPSAIALARGSPLNASVRSRHSAPHDTHTISFSLRAYIDLFAKAGCDQTIDRVGPPKAPLLFVGSRMWARLISS